MQSDINKDIHVVILSTRELSAVMIAGDVCFFDHLIDCDYQLATLLCLCTRAIPCDASSIESHTIFCDDLAVGPGDMIGSSQAENCVAVWQVCITHSSSLHAVSLGQHAPHCASKLAVRVPAMPSLVWEKGHPGKHCSP